MSSEKPASIDATILKVDVRPGEYVGTPPNQTLLMLGDIVSGYQEGGPDYVRALMTGYAPEAPAYKRDGKGKLVAVHDVAAEDKKALELCATVAAGEGDSKDTCNTVQDGMNYNAAFPGHQISMPPPT